MRRSLFVLMSLMVFSVFALAQGSASADQENEAKKLFNEANGLFRSGNYAAALEKGKAAIALGEDYRYHYLVGLCYKNIKQYGDAIASLQASVKLQPNFAGSHNAIGGVYLIQGDFADALDAFKTALKYDPKLKPALSGIAEAYAGRTQQLMDEGKLEEAGEIADEGIQQNSNTAKLFLLAARVYNKLEKPDKALDAANRALQLKKGRSKGAEYFEVGIAYKKMKDFSKARSAFTEARKDPTYARNAQYELDGIKGK